MTTMTATSTTTSSAARASRRPLWRPALLSGLAAAAATTAFAAALHAAGVSLEINGEPIPPSGFFSLTLMCVAAGYVLAVTVRRFAGNPHRMFVRSTVTLTALSFVPDLMVAATSTGTRSSLMVMHVVAAVIVIPTIASRLADHR